MRLHPTSGTEALPLPSGKAPHPLPQRIENRREGTPVAPPPAVCSSLFAAGSLDRLFLRLLGFPLFMGAPRLGLHAPPANRCANASHKAAGRNALRSPPAACSSLLAAGSLDRLLFRLLGFALFMGVLRLGLQA